MCCFIALKARKQFEKLNSLLLLTKASSNGGKEKQSLSGHTSLLHFFPHLSVCSYLRHFSLSDLVSFCQPVTALLTRHELSGSLIFSILSLKSTRAKRLPSKRNSRSCQLLLQQTCSFLPLFSWEPMRRTQEFTLFLEEWSCFMFLFRRNLGFHCNYLRAQRGPFRQLSCLHEIRQRLTLLY